MAGIGAYLKNAWNKEPLIVASCGIGLLAVILPIVSPWTKYGKKLNQAVPIRYPVPVRDNGNMPDIPAHPRDPIGNKLEWFKDF